MLRNVSLVSVNSFYGSWFQLFMFGILRVWFSSGIQDFSRVETACMRNMKTFISCCLCIYCMSFCFVLFVDSELNKILHVSLYTVYTLQYFGTKYWNYYTLLLLLGNHISCVCVNKSNKYCILFRFKTC